MTKDIIQALNQIDIELSEANKLTDESYDLENIYLESYGDESDLNI